MEIKNTREKEMVVLPDDIDLVNILLENADICIDEEISDLEGTVMTLETGIIFKFDIDGNLLGIEERG